MRHSWMDGGRCGEFLSKDRLEKTENGQLSEELVVHVNQMPDGKKVCGVQYLQVPRSRRRTKIGQSNTRLETHFKEANGETKDTLGGWC